MMAFRTGNPGLRSAAGVALFLCLFLPVPGSPAAAAKAASKKPIATFQMPKVRLVANSTPVAMATVRASRKPVSLGTVSYLIGDYRTSYDLLVSPRRDGGLVWMARQQGKSRVQEQGTISAAQLKGTAEGHLCIIVEKEGAKPSGVTASGKRFRLFSRFSPSYRAMLVACPKQVPAKPVRTALFIESDNQPLGSDEPKGAAGAGTSGSPLPWQLGAKAYRSALDAHKRHKKPVALYFYQKNSKACKQMDSELLTACRVQEVLGPAVKVRIDPSAGTKEKAIAARYGVTSTPALLVLPPGTEKATWVVPEKPGQKFDPSMPCHFHELLAAALKPKK